MRLICYKAMCGDAYHLQYVGESGRKRNIFLDMGHPKTYTRVLKDVVSDFVVASEHIDAIFLSHIHDDHIGGAIRFIKDMQHDGALRKVVSRWIYNAPRKYDIENTFDNKDGVKCGIVSGDKIYEHIMENRPADLCDFIEGQSFVIDGLRITIISPNTASLKQLRDKYANNRPFCKNETDEISIEAGYAVNDYSTPLNKFKPELFKEDNNIENASSIAAIFEYEEKRILWLSDSVPSVTIPSLSKLGYSVENKLYCNAMLLSHHGSAANNCLDLFKMVRADKYIISSDGINRHCLPNKETIARVISASQTFPVTLCFNYDDGRLMKMFESDESDLIRKKISVHYLEDGEVIEI